MVFSQNFAQNGKRDVHSVLRPGRGPVSTKDCHDWNLQSVQVVGRPIRMEVERSAFPEKIDHFWISLSVPQIGSVLLAINTTSLRNRRAGFDDRLRVGIVKSRFHQSPVMGISRSRLLNYRSIEENANVFYEHYERVDLEELLREETLAAAWVQAWGASFCKPNFGLHQIHCRRASCAVPQDLRQMDGALRFYRTAESEARLFLFKFCGQ